MCPVTLSLILFCWRSLPPQSVTLSRTPMMLTGWRCAAHLMLQIKPARWNRKKRLCLCSRCRFQNKTNSIPPHCNDAKVNKKNHKTELRWTPCYLPHMKKIIAFFSLLSWKLTSSLLFKPSCWSFYFESNDSAGQSNLTHLPSYNRSSITEDSELGQKTSGDCKNNI